ncbi:MAG TPA: sulfotransferase, partial [Gammaproteobacteria bacterium]|nr:sulfotransferase [Gammaproteobacteria bacterium]
LQRLSGDFLQAAEAARKAVSLSPRNPLAVHTLGAALHAQGRTVEAISYYQTAVRLQPGMAESHYYLANALRETGNITEAIDAYKMLLRIDANHFGGLNNYGALLTNTGGAEEAITVLMQALGINQNSVETLTNLARAQVLIGAHEMAIKHLQKALSLRPDFLDAYMELAWAFRLEGKYDNALQSFSKALELSPGNSRAQVGKAKILEIIGRRQEAYDIILPYIKAKKPEALPVYYDLSTYFGEHEQAAGLMLEFLENDNVNTLGTSPIHFRLGNYFDKTGDFPAAFRHYREANTLSNKSFSIEDTERRFQAITECYSHDFLTDMPHSGNPSELPIFIVGMPRSGTSLVEQIIASHPDIHGLGETTNIENIARQLSVMTGSGQYPDFIRNLSSTSLDKVSLNYTDRLAKVSPEAMRVTDKMPHNFVFIGFIYQLFPNSRIIHCKRNPLDTCLSCYFSEFASNFHNYTYDLENLAAYYRLYQNMMNHWNSVFPGRIYDISYESLVSDQEHETRKLLEFCGVEWSDQCLDFHRSERVVNTISYNQVRQPMYKKSVNRWKNYESYLAPYLDLLDNVKTESGRK